MLRQTPFLIFFALFSTSAGAGAVDQNKELFDAMRVPVAGDDDFMVKGNATYVKSAGGLTCTLSTPFASTTSSKYSCELASVIDPAKIYEILDAQPYGLADLEGYKTLNKNVGGMVCSHSVPKEENKHLKPQSSCYLERRISVATSTNGPVDDSTLSKPADALPTGNRGLGDGATHPSAPSQSGEF